jgi:hypothetical protein
MREDISLYNALDDCIERMDTGEALEDVLRDYPTQAENLRELLMIAQVVGQLDDIDDEAVDARSRSIEKVKQAVPLRPRQRSRWALPLTAAATFLIAVGIGAIGLFALGGGGATLSSEDLTAANIFLNSGTVGAIGTDFAQTDIAALPTDVELVSTSVIQATAMPIIATGTASLTGATATPSPLPTSTVTATTTSQPTATPSATVSNSGTTVIQQTAVPTGTSPQPPISASGDSEDATATAVMQFLLDITATAVARSELALTVTPTEIITGDTVDVATLVPSPLPSPTQSDRPFAGLIEVTPGPFEMNSDVRNPFSAGSIDDNADFDNFLLYRRNVFAAFPNHPTEPDITLRQTITVTDADGFPVNGARVAITADGRSVTTLHTTADGGTFFYPNIGNVAQSATVFEVSINKADIAETFTLDLRDGPDWTFQLDTGQPLQPTVPLDIVFVLDTTESMSDDMFELQRTLFDVTSTVNQLPVEARYGLVVYGDDAFDTLPLNDDSLLFWNQVVSLEVAGGGETPEALAPALNAAINDIEWESSDRDAIRIVFVIGDAPPYASDNALYREAMLNALNEGIAIHTVAIDGLDPLTEFIYRQIAQFTGGTFVFTTAPNGFGDNEVNAEGGGNDAESTPREPDFTIETLDAILLRLIREDVEAQLREP